MNKRSRLLELLRTRSFQEREVTLSSGLKSNFYIDCKQVSLDAEGALLIGELFHQQINEIAPRAVAVGGLTLGADPLATATSIASFQAGQPRAAFLVRKEPKGHGTNQWVESTKLPAGAPVVILEDVVTTGASTLRAIERARLAGLEVICALGLVDRLEGGREAVEAQAPLHTLFTPSGLSPGSMMRAILLSLVTLILGCASAPPKIDLSGKWPTLADDYDRTTEAWTRRTNLRDQYQEVLEVAAIIRSPQWRAAHASRDAYFRKLEGTAREQRMAQAFAEAGGSFELELMVTTWDRRENDLDRGKKSVWRIAMIDEKGNEIAPLEIVKDKRPAFTIRADFAAFGDFATAYIARFPRDARILGDGVTRVRFRMSSVRGGVELEWHAPK